MIHIPISPSMPCLEHIVLENGERYTMCDYCSLKEWKVTEKGVVHFLIEHATGEYCACSANHHAQIIPPPVYAQK